MNIKILVAYHKPSALIKNECFVPIQVGKALANDSLDMIGDDSSDNISVKNPIYCEMSAAYWGWKNLDADYLGLCHYRRIFTFQEACLKLRMARFLLFYLAKFKNILHPGYNRFYTKLIKVSSEKEYLDIAHSFSQKLSNILENNRYDVIVPYPVRFSSINVKRFLELELHEKEMFYQVVKEIAPDFYPYFEESLNSNILYAANTIILKRNLYNDYCNTIFTILAEHEKRLIENGWCYNVLSEKCYSRHSGYYAEWLTNAYVFKMRREKKKILEVNIAFLDN